MADDQMSQLRHWQNLRTQAENGELVFEKDLAGKLAARCDAMELSLDLAVEKATDLQYVSGFGGLRSAQALQQKFANKAVADDDWAVNRLNLAIAILKEMRATFELAGKQITETDEATSQALGNAANDLP